MTSSSLRLDWHDFAAGVMLADGFRGPRDRQPKYSQRHVKRQAAKVCTDHAVTNVELRNPVDIRAQITHHTCLPTARRDVSPEKINFRLDRMTAPSCLFGDGPSTRAARCAADFSPALVDR